MARRPRSSAAPPNPLYPTPHGLPPAGLEAAVQAGLPHLELLNLGGCISLSRLLLPEQAPRLRRLDVSGCGALRQVVAGSKALERLAARACGRLLVSAGARGCCCCCCCWVGGRLRCAGSRLRCAGTALAG